MAREEKKGPPVLIVEDDEEMLLFLQGIVRAEGFRTESAIDGLEAVRMMARLNPAAAVMDLMLPRYGGIEMLYELRRNKETKGIPIVVVTARYTSAEDKAIIEAQANVKAFFTKPVSPDELVPALRRAIGR